MTSTARTLRLLGLLAVMAVAAGPLGTARAGDPDEEEAESVRDSLRYVPTPEEYRRSLELTGMEAHLRSRAMAKPASATGLGTWTSVGPVGDPIATGEMPAPGSENNGRIRSIQIRANTSGYEVYVGASDGGLWRAYSNTGPVWASLGDNLRNPSVGAFAVNPNDDTDILVGTGDYGRVRADGSGLYRTRDRGLTWSFVATAGIPNAYFRILYDPNNSSVVLAASTFGLYRSEHGSAGPFDLVLDGMVSDLVIHPTSPGLQYCCRSKTDSGGVYRSVDDGKTWRLMTDTWVPRDRPHNAALALCRNAPQNLLYAYGSGPPVEGFQDTLSGVFKSSDGGATWASIDVNTMPGRGQAFHVLSAAIDPRNPQHLFVGVNELNESNLGGAPGSWQNQTAVVAHQDDTQLYFSPLTGDRQMWVCNDGGLHVLDIDSHTATSWNGNSNTGLRVSEIDYMDASRDLIVIDRQDDGSLSSDDNGASWRVHFCCDGLGTAITNDYFPFTYWFNVNQAVHLQPFSGAPIPVANGPAIIPVVYDRFTSEVFSLFSEPAQTRVLHRQADGTGTWFQDLSGVPSGLGDLSVNLIDGRTLYAWGGQTFAVIQHPGSVWAPVLTATLPNNIYSVFPSHEHPRELWAGLSGAPNSAKLMHSTDGGATWTEADGKTQLDGGLRNVGTVKAVIAAPFHSSELYAGTNIGVFQSLDGGYHWAPFQDGLPVVEVTAMRYIVDRTFAGNDKLVISTYGRGIYERTLPHTPLVYVDPRNPVFPPPDGTFNHGFLDFGVGQSNTPPGGRLALFGDGGAVGTYVVPPTLTQPMLIDAWGAPVTLIPGTAAPQRVTAARSARPAAAGRPR